MRPSGAFRVLDAAKLAGILPEATLAASLEEAKRTAQDPVEVATQQLGLPREALYRALAEQRGLPFVEGVGLRGDPGLLSSAPARLLVRKRVLPLGGVEAGVRVATSDPDDESTLDALRRVWGRPLVLEIAEPTALEAALRAQVGGEAAEAQRFDAVQVLDDLLRQATLRRASDLHLDPQPEGLVMRARVDGHMVPVGGVLAGPDAAALISRIKVLGGLDIAERREPQDGGFRYVLDASAGRTLDVRLATIPTRLGERATLRLLGSGAEAPALPELGFEGDDLARLREALTQPHGMVLLTGPTGSGKTTTLYAALAEVAGPARNVLTVEDPVERVIPGVSQVPVDRAGKVTFAGALRSLLRHDPDVLMVGEIRDEETADVAVRAAMTGHLVLSSLHANRAAGAPGRLIDLGCKPFMVGAVLRAVVAQRLVRRLCVRCRAEQVVAGDALRSLGASGEGIERVWEPKGCAACVGTGYAGRVALSEALWMDEALEEAVTEGVSEAVLRRRLRERGGRTLADDGLVKVLRGDTSVTEAVRARI